jgi:hypothetical protein
MVNCTKIIDFFKVTIVRNYCPYLDLLSVAFYYAFVKCLVETTRLTAASEKLPL